MDEYSENFNKKTENIKNQLVLKNRVTEMKNMLENQQTD